jgi:hypothetical protein
MQDSISKESLYSSAFHGREGAIKEFQNRLVLLNHAATCQSSNNRPFPKPCRGFPSCYEMVQLLNHVNSCEVKECNFPSCVSTRYLLAHNKSCLKDDCIICKPLKDSIKRKNERNKNVVTVLKRKRVGENGSFVDEVSPLSTPRLESDVERKRAADHATSGESESDTASQLSNNLYNALAYECFDEILETMNECLNIPDDFSIPLPSPPMQSVPELQLQPQQPLPQQSQQQSSSSQSQNSPNTLPPQAPAIMRRPIPTLPLHLVAANNVIHHGSSSQPNSQRFPPTNASDFPDLSPRILIGPFSQMGTNSPRLSPPPASLPLQQALGNSPRIQSPVIPQQQLQQKQQQIGISPRLSPVPPHHQQQQQAHIIGLSPRIIELQRSHSYHDDNNDDDSQDTPRKRYKSPRVPIPVLPLQSLGAFSVIPQSQTTILSARNIHNTSNSNTARSIIVQESAIPVGVGHTSSTATSSSENSFRDYHCAKCTTEIGNGYRYYCEVCRINLCMKCFHCEDGGQPHEHPIRAIKIDALNAMINQLL